MAKQTTPVREPELWGLSVAKWREISAFCLFALALLLLLSLVSENLGRAWIGAFGSTLAYGAWFVLGRWVAFVLPALLLLAAIHAFRGRVPFHPIRKIFSGILILASLCALLALPASFYATESGSAEMFQQGGLLGHFLTNSQGLRLGEILGPAGAYLVLSAVFLLGIMLSTDFLFVPVIRRVLQEARALVTKWKTRRPVAVLHFERETGPRVFPVTGAPAAPRNIPPEPEQKEPDAEEKKEHQPDIEKMLPRLNNLQEKKTGQEPRRPSRMLQTELDFAPKDYRPPPVELFSEPPVETHPMDREEVLETSAELEKALGDFNISARVVAVTQGPVVTQYELQPAPGVKVSRILSLENDIALILRARSVRIQAPIPGKAAIGIEVPNRKVTPVYFRDIIESSEFCRQTAPLAFALGKNISGEPVICDLAIMPHLLIAGTTGSGKSVCVNSIISSMLSRMPPEKVKFIMIDPKRVELNVYSDIPHLLAPVVNEPRQAAAALLWAVQQMQERLRTFSEMRVRNIDGYNAVVTGERPPARGVHIENRPYLPHIVIIIDELADLMLIAKNEVEDFVVRLAQMSRAAGIHLIIATQRPSVNVLTGIIKANFPSRIAFRVSAKVDSRTILDMNGAETLLGRGDMLFSPGGTKPMRIQGAFVSDSDVEKLADYLRAQTPAAYEKEDFLSAVAAELQTDGAELESGILGPHHSLENGENQANIENEEEDAEEDWEEEESPEPRPTRPPAMPRPKPQPGLSRLASLGAPSQVEFPDLPLKGDVEDDEELYIRALRMVLESRKPSVSMIQRRLKIGFARAGRLMDLMEERGIVGPYLGSKPRDLIIDDPEGLLRRLDEMERERGT